ncbi:2-amino-4-hydroxy-6-hydroxymethyldihydropteridine diphosphokinase [Brevibacterium sp. 50QC2O2]|uniref:2-amino-4-hydroxy-6- hydroxymethyldihydropteridine diphosphokinase n=1 Tax=Brevibacterium TaxID=1696 RepID=UPI00211BFC44|nr:MULTISPECIES: 2-amino-4-hydroxy-6-hydroxymethyldihydropteridine diphosphokinase [unclassified Brevibacterium]MCQ9368173.1 2-amino-4-hydroxy-6-hydroxymethyldihydropteridine diphosphokinase [Brevibacterium sp. 91QC2O2]MCQ9385512.1 2-amino-4-hydroxy-6-hydroxymethyldihydropteridine diphosphokinase [Brevibacterium sp. 68QC2CO]MCQ9387296.1 2-amino-4-hydroxy-6-hydroxymethyldihydropteridine diphosphokinase [Brevibacterium sp. 50QC2O2]
MNQPLDRIELTGLKVFGYHGVFDHEKRDGQDFIVDVVLHADLAPAAGSDDLADTVDYGGLAEEVAAIVEGEPFDLIETLAGTIAEHCLTKAERVEVTVHKPHAPIQRSFDDVAVHVERTRRAVRPQLIRAVLSLGSNMGSSADTLDAALEALAEHPRISVEAISSKYSTAPVGGVEQDDFVNAAALVTSSLSPRELLAVCQGIELAHGRRRLVHWGPRTLDIDLIRVTDASQDIDDPLVQIMSSDPVLTLPHPQAAGRAFVLAPWAELRPAARLRAAAITRTDASDPDTATVEVTRRAAELAGQGIRRLNRTV